MDKQNQVDPKDKKWIDAIAAYDREFKKWKNRAQKIVRSYRDFDQTQGESTKNVNAFNILWSNVQVLMPATFARLPKPDVSRRFRDNDPVGRVAALLLERALSYEIEHYQDYKSAMANSVQDRFLGGRGTAWVRYEPHIVAVPGEPADGVQITEDADEANPNQEAQAAQAEEIEYECAPVDYVHWEDFIHEVVRTWEENTFVGRRVYMNRDALVKRFGEDLAKKIPLDTRPASGGDNMRTTSADESHQACIYEFWDKSTGMAVWFSKGLQKVIDERPDPLKLANFFPCPRPLYATITSDNLVPVPDYKIYQSQAQQLNKLSSKIDGLIDMLQVKGVYASDIPELARLFKEAGNGTLLPVKNWNAFSEKAGLKGSMDLVDLAPIVNALNVAYDAAEKVKNQIYELMGISDIVRGASDPAETLGAQKLKGTYGNMRLRAKQDDVVTYATSLLQMKAEIMCMHFQPQSLMQIAAVEQLSPEDQQLVPQALVLLMGERATNPELETSSSPLSSFRIEVTSDSMIQMDEAQEKIDRTEFLTAVGGFLEKMMPMAQANPQAAPLIIGLLKFGVSGFKVGKTVEGMIDAALDQMTKQAAQPQPPAPDPEAQKLQAQKELEDKKLENARLLKQEEVQAQTTIATNEQRVQAEQNAHQQQLESQRAGEQARMDAALEQQRMQFEARLQASQQASDERIASMANDVKLLIADRQAAAGAKAAANQQAPGAPQ